MASRNGLARPAAETDRMATEQTLRDRDTLLAQVQAAAKLGVWVWDGTTDTVTWTDELSRMLGVPAGYDPNVAKTSAAFHPPGDRQRVSEAFRRVTKDGVPYDLQLPLVTATGQERWVRTAAVAQVDDGRVQRVFGMIQDLTDLHQGQEAVRLLNDRLRRFIQANILGIAIARRDGQIIEANDYYLDLVGYSREELDRGELNSRALTPPEWAAADEQALAELHATGRCRPFRKEYLLRDGHRVPIMITDASLGPDDEIAAFVLDARDSKGAEQRTLTDTAQLEQELRTHATALRTANRDIEGFTYSVSHDLRAPLRSIDAFARILAEEHGSQLDKEGRRVLGIIIRNTARLGALIDDLLSLSRIGRRTLQPRPVDMDALATEVASELRAAEPDRSITFRIANLCAVHGDPALLRVVWQHLLGNAAKYTRGKRNAKIVVSCQAEPDSTRYVVEDNGAGYDPAYAEKLFLPFQRLHGTDAFEGTGIGLAIVAQIVQRHGGTVWSSGAVGKGATFGFSIPVDKR